MAAAASSSPSSNRVPPTKFEVPDGWVVGRKRNRRGKIAKCYMNIVGQTFFTESDLMRNIRYSEERRYNLYCPYFVPPTSGPFVMRSKPNLDTASTSNARDRRSTLRNSHQHGVEGHQDDAHQSRLAEALTDDEVQCARALLEISGKRSSSVGRRASRRVAGLQPELQVEFEFDRALEYVIKDKPQH